MERTIQGFILEMYAYFTMVANITPYGLDETRTVPLDLLLNSLGEQLAGYNTFGVVFLSIYDLFCFIPRVSLLSQRCLQPEIGSVEKLEVIRSFRSLQADIERWQLPVGKPSEEAHTEFAPGETMRSITAAACDIEHQTVAEIYRQALLIYLKASMCGPVVSNEGVLREIQHHVETVLPLLEVVAFSTLGAILQWPVMIVCSCLVRDSHQAMTKAGFRKSPFTTGNVEQAVELLDYLWRDPAPEAYGPYGLHYVMRKMGISFCMS